MVLDSGFLNERMKKIAIMSRCVGWLVVTDSSSFWGLRSLDYSLISTRSSTFSPRNTGSLGSFAQHAHLR